ncbi:MAG TPA: sensor histidine kinase [Chryseolinea sp.]|nr:sensor histidine kinase [Chryseolinea sp.]
MSKLFSNFYTAIENDLNVETTRMKIPKPPTGLQVNDVGFRLILIPFFGIAIPLVTGMINGQNFSNLQIKLSFLYTIFIAFLIWEGNRFLHYSLRSYFDWINKPIQKISILVLSITFYTVPVSVLLLVGWYKLFTADPVDWNTITEACLAIMISVIFITHVYETVYLVKESESEMIRNEQLERAKVEAELEALKNQIDPHFIFNSLNTLSHLIEERPVKAKLFNDNLADVYRYILQNKARDLVLLKDEMSFLESYFLLLKIRFEAAVTLIIEISEEQADHYLIPPISLQLLAENAIKHNEFSDDVPLVFKVSLRNDELIVWNALSKKELRKPSSRIGLQNLRERYRLTTAKEIGINENAEEFVVTLPLLRIL